MSWLSRLFQLEKPKPKIELLSMSNNEVANEISLAGLKPLYPCLLDTAYYYTKAEDWAEVFDYIYFKFNMPSYLAERIDCDDFAILLKGLVASFFGLNHFGVVFGNTPIGYHTWNRFRTDNGLVYFEPQTGKYFPIGEKGYSSEWILL